MSACLPVFETKITIHESITARLKFFRPFGRDPQPHRLTFNCSDDGKMTPEIVVVPGRQCLPENFRNAFEQFQYGSHVKLKIGRQATTVAGPTDHVGAGCKQRDFPLADGLVVVEVATER